MKYLVTAISRALVLLAGASAAGCSSSAAGDAFGAGGAGVGGSSSGGGEGGGLTTLVPASLRATAVAVGSAHGCAILADNGAVVCWGDGSSGQLGDGMSGKGYQRATPGLVPGITGAVGIRAGLATTCALTASEVLCWGNGSFGQLGDGMSGDGYVVASPAPVPGLGNVRDLSMNGSNACAVLADGTVRCWGLNADEQWLGFTSDQCGPYQTVDSAGEPQLVTYPCQSSPQHVSGLVGATGVAAGGEHACAILKTGKVTCWGADNFGQLGDGNYGKDAFHATPEVVAGLAGVIGLGLGSSHSCALTSAGLVQCWGDNSFGQLGIGTAALDSYKTSPTLAHMVDGAVALDAAARTTCVVLAAGGVSCWGDTTSLLAVKPPAKAEISVQAKTIPTPVSAVEVRTSGGHACLRAADGSVICWGKNDVGQLGNGSMAPQDFSNTPVVAGPAIPPG